MPNIACQHEGTLRSRRAAGPAAGLDDALLFRTMATLPFVREAGLDPAARLLFQDPAILPRLFGAKR